jgi:tRNA-splicing endonuclease subunit Sen54
MGSFVTRELNVSTGEAALKAKRLELLPEEALYLIERGSLFCWINSESGPPLSVQQAFAEIIGKDNLTLERYQVQSLLQSFRLDLFLFALRLSHI